MDTNKYGTFNYNIEKESSVGLILKNPKYEFSNKGARGDFNITFSIKNRDLWETEKYVFILDLLSEDNFNQNNFYCRVRFANNNSYSYNWKTCSFSNILNEVTLIPYTDMIMNSVDYVLELSNIRVPTQDFYYNFSAKVVDQFTSKEILYIDNVAQPAKTASSIFTNT